MTISQRLIALSHFVRSDIDLLAHGVKFVRYLGHSSLLVIQRRRIIPYILRDLHRAELRAAHGAEVRHLVRFLRQRLVVIFTRGVGIELSSAAFHPGVMPFAFSTAVASGVLR